MEKKDACVYIGTFFVSERGCSGGDGNDYLFRTSTDIDSSRLDSYVDIYPGQRLQVINEKPSGRSCCSGFNHYLLYVLKEGDKEVTYNGWEDGSDVVIYEFDELDREIDEIPDEMPNY
jgi:hypothetical protein